jgi:hypothetical protein
MHVIKLPGTKCCLSPMTPDDAEQFTIWLNDLEVTENLTYGRTT